EDERKRQSNARRKRLRLLYVIHDLLHHSAVHEPDPVYAQNLEQYLPKLFTTTVFPGARKQKKRVDKLLDIWEEKRILEAGTIASLRQTVKDAVSATGDSLQAQQADKDIQAKPDPSKNLLLPEQHGDPSLPFYDLPAANMIPHMIANTTTPISAKNVKPIKFDSRKPSQELIAAVDDLVRSVADMYGNQDIGKADSDAIGGTVGIDGEGYYGWSKSFCESMK